VVIALDGDAWQLRGCLGREWEWHVGPDKPWDAPGWLPARVPGSVVDDLVRAGEVLDPYHERNSRLTEWASERAWVYRRRLRVDAEPAVLEFDGVDYAATVFVDGVEAAHHDGMFTPFEVGVSAGEHLLAVVVHPAPESEPQVGATSRVRVHKSRMGYGWDFCPRLVHQGIWRPVSLRVGEPPRVSPHVGLVDGTGVVEIDGEVVLRVESPELWWPNGMGEQHLYSVRGGDRELAVGFREVEFKAPGEFVVNGVAMPVRGWNWVPIDALYGVPRPEKVAHLLGLAAHANVNLLRVWGGGLIESDEFYDLCDRLGLLVWQDFSMSSSGMESVPSDDPAFVSLMAEEARRIVPRLRHHASLAVWCGGNELSRDDDPLDDSTPVLGALRDVVRELDPERGWVPTSPAGDGDVHGPWEHQGLRRHNGHYDAGTWSLHSEFGVEGMTNRRALAALIDEPRRWPADRTNPVYEHLGAWWNNADLVQHAFGDRIGDVETMRRASQHLQYDGLRYAVESNRRRGSGTVPWQFNESFPNAWCTAAVDHRGDPKPAYYGVARAYRPVHVCASFAAWAWGGEDEVRARIHAWGGGRTMARLLNADGSVVAETDADEIAAPVSAFSSDVLILDLVTDSVQNRYVMSRNDDLAPMLDLEPTRLEAELDGDGGYLHLHLHPSTSSAALGIVLEDARPYEAPGWVVFEDNMIDLLPGETRTIRVEGAGELLVEGWNVEARRVG
jgi:beta-mannosidase